ncbi:MAG: hypothetical protein JWN14_3776 [Chthonomonadales bacterium]|nr:hypothetical protein [Chthonomonadales bacterium]
MIYPLPLLEERGFEILTDQIATSTSPVDAINRAAACAQAMRRPAQWLAWGAALYVGGTVGIVALTLLVQALSGQPTDKGIPLLPVLCVQPLMLPCLVVAGWYWKEAERLRSAFRELKGIFVPEQNDPRQIAPPSAIGPLLEATLAEATLLGMWQEKELASATALLDALLRSVREEDAVILTDFQRQRLHEIVITRGRDNWFLGSGGVGGKNTVIIANLRGKLRPAAITALGVLGNSSSLPTLERFAKTTQNATLRASSLLSIEQIQKRLRYGSEQMLRAAGTPANPETLLRPTTTEDTQTPVQELLRPKDPTT